MFGHSFYHGALRKYIIMFGNMFNDLEVGRYNSSGQLIQSIAVPISYGPKEKFLARMREDPNLNRPFSTVLPRLSFEILNVSYDATRSYNKMNRILNTSSGGDVLKTQNTPAPYDINMVLYGMFANNEDAVQVVEQILPFFRPEWTHSIKITSDMNEYFDVPTILDDMSIEDSYEADFQTRRAIIYTFNFTIKGYMFGPVRNKGVIKRTKVTATSLDTNRYRDSFSRITTTPGLLANGSATESSTASVPISQIDANSNYGFAFDQEDYFDVINRKVDIGVTPADEEAAQFEGITPFFALSASPLIAQEGENVANTAPDNVIVTLQALGVPDRTRVPWTITGISSADITKNLTGYFTVLDQEGKITIPVRKDFLTESTEYMNIALDNGQANVTVTITDTSFDRKFFLSVSPNTSIAVSGNDQLVFNLTTENVPEGSSYRLGAEGFSVANGTVSNSAMSTSTGNNSFVIANGSSSLTFDLFDDVRSESGNNQVKFFIKGFDNAKNEANVSINITNITNPTLNMLSFDQISNSSNVTQTLSAINFNESDQISYNMISDLSPLRKDIFTSNTISGTISANTSSNTAVLALQIEQNEMKVSVGNNSLGSVSNAYFDAAANTFFVRDYLERYVASSINFTYRELFANSSGTFVDSGSTGAGASFKLKNDALQDNMNSYEVVVSAANNGLLQAEGYDVNSSAANTFNVQGIFPTINMTSCDSILYLYADAVSNVYVSNNVDHTPNTAISNSQIVINQDTSSGEYLIFAPKDPGNYYYWSESNNQSHGTITVATGNTSIYMPIVAANTGY